MQSLSDNLYSVNAVVRLEQIAINQFDIAGYTLMKRAGKAAFSVIKHRYPQSKKILVLCGAGNNAGDGYVVATLAKQAGLDVHVISLLDPATLKNEVLLAYQHWHTLAHNTVADISFVSSADIIIDALLGTGLKTAVSDEWQSWMKAVNQSKANVISLDLPSGLIADTGVIAGYAIQADITVCFIGLKQGMFTAQANDVCGEIILDDLKLPLEVYSQFVADAHVMRSVDYTLLEKRKPSSNKGNFGHVLIVGGNVSMPGAVILAAKAALRTGAGLVTILTVAENLQAICMAVPEAMVKTCDKNTCSEVLNVALLSKITHIAIGMGLGQDAWSLQLLRACAQLNKPLLIDADGLNLISQHKILINASLVITPHPGEAARLLSAEEIINNADIQDNRFSAIKHLHDSFFQSESCVVVLKGSGTLIYDGKAIKVCALGNAALAAPGMGDVLSGIIIALMAQKIAINEAVELAVCLHAAAAHLVTQDKTRGLLASDVVDALPAVLQ